MALENAPQTLLVFRGPVGVGKSALSRALGRRLGWPVVDKDDYSDVLMAHMENYGPPAYESMFSAAGSLLSQGFSVICDSPLRGEVGYLHAEALAAQTPAALRVVSCTLSDETLWKVRLEARDRRPAHVLKTWEDLTRYREQARSDFDYATDAPTFTADLADSLEGLTEEISIWLNPRSGGAR